MQHAQTRKTKTNTDSTWITAVLLSLYQSRTPLKVRGLLKQAPLWEKCHLPAAPRAAPTPTAEEIPQLSFLIVWITTHNTPDVSLNKNLLLGHYTHFNIYQKNLLLLGTGDFFFPPINKHKTTPERVFPLLFCTVLTFLNWQVKGHASGEKTADF